MFRIIKRVTIKFFEDSCLVRASGLAYSSLLAMVPFTTVVFAFGGFEALSKTIETAFLRTIVPTYQEAFSTALNTFTQNSLTTGALGMAFFLLTSLFLINNIARNFDAIWGVNDKGNFFRRYTTYTAILVFGSLLLGVSISGINRIDSFIHLIGLGQETDGNTFLFILPYLLILSIFFLMFLIIPSTRVRPKYAIISAFFSSALFESVKIGFEYWTIHSVRTSLIYGSLALIPIFLVSLYMFWLIVLIGVQLTYFLQNEKNPTHGNPGFLNMEERIGVGIDLFLCISRYHMNSSAGGITLRELEVKLGQSPSVIESFIHPFSKTGLVLVVSGKPEGYIPGRSLDQLTISNVVLNIYGGSGSVALLDEKSKINAEGFSAGGYNALDKRSILEVLKDSEGK